MLAKNGIDVAVSLPSDREIAFTCVFQRSPRLLFEAWTKPEHLQVWWGCESATVTRCEIDLRIGGHWNLVMEMPDGSVHPFQGVYQEIEQDRRLVYTECYDVPQFGRPQWVTTITFEKTGSGTRLTHTILHHSKEARDRHLQSGMETGTRHMLQRLDEVTARMEKRA
jgi:uncharacterized protein YndB with AHSA1/START domain